MEKWKIKMKKRFKILASLIFLLTMASPVFASDIPKPITDYLQAAYPKINIRFDGLVEMPDGTQYLPVFPLNLADVTNPTDIVMTIPAKKPLGAKPDMILFADNFAFFKIIREPGESPTLSSSNDIPLVVKMGILPQDLIVPKGLELPPTLRVLLGDLKIPIKGEKDYEQVIPYSGQTKQDKHSLISKTIAPVIAPELRDLADKTYYVSNLQTNEVYVVPAETGRAEKIIKLSSIPFEKVLTSDGRCVLITCMASNKLAIIDTFNKAYVKEIPVGDFPTEIVIGDDINQAFIINKASSSVSIVDLNDMKVINEIKAIGSPRNLNISEDNNTLYYNDEITGNIYKLAIPEINKPRDILEPIDPNVPTEQKSIFQVSNISKICEYNNCLFILSRSDNKVYVYNLIKNKLEKTIDVGAKPVDMKIFPDKSKLYVLSAGNDSISIINTDKLEVSNTITLKHGGFLKNINLLPVENKALISTVDSYEMAYIDLAQEKVITYIPIGINVGSLTISEPPKN